MSFFQICLLVFEGLCSVTLIGLVLIQKSKSEGLGLAFGSGGGGDSLFGSRAGNVLTKATVTVAIIFLLNTILLAVLFGHQHQQSLVDKYVKDAPAPFSVPAPPPVPVAE